MMCVLNQCRKTLFSRRIQYKQQQMNISYPVFKCYWISKYSKYLIITKIEKGKTLMCFCVFLIIKTGLLKGTIDFYSQHRHHTKPAWWATERKLWADIKSLGCALHWEWGELQTGTTSVLEIFHMPGRYRKAYSVNRKVCFQKRETNSDTQGGGLNGLPNRPEFSCANTG